LHMRCFNHSLVSQADFSEEKNTRVFDDIARRFQVNEKKMDLSRSLLPLKPFKSKPFELLVDFTNTSNDQDRILSLIRGSITSLG
jgi:hypothetical protein